VRYFFSDSNRIVRVAPRLVVVPPGPVRSRAHHTHPLQVHALEMAAAAPRAAVRLSLQSRIPPLRAGVARAFSSAAPLASARAEVSSESDGGVSALPHVLLFPGQGAQKPGMGKDLAEHFAAARLVFEEVDEALKERLRKTMFEGTEVREGEGRGGRGRGKWGSSDGPLADPKQP
jgi:hypothetical protein